MVVVVGLLACGYMEATYLFRAEMQLVEAFHLATVHAPFLARVDYCRRPSFGIRDDVLVCIIDSAPRVNETLEQITSSNDYLLCHILVFFNFYHPSLSNHPSLRNQASVLHSTSMSGSAGPT